MTAFFHQTSPVTLRFMDSGLLPAIAIFAPGTPRALSRAPLASSGGPIRFSLRPDADPRDHSASQLGSPHSRFHAKRGVRLGGVRSAALHGKQYSGARYCVAMSEENVKAVRDAAEAFNRGDLDTWAGYLADDIDYRAVEGAPDDHGPIHGKEAIRAYLQDLARDLRRFHERAGRADRCGRGQRRRCHPNQRPRQAEWRRNGSDLRRPLHAPRHEGCAGPRVLDTRGSARSRPGVAVALRTRSAGSMEAAICRPASKRTGASRQPRG